MNEQGTGGEAMVLTLAAMVASRRKRLAEIEKEAEDIREELRGVSTASKGLPRRRAKMRKAATRIPRVTEQTMGVLAASRG
jgi:hypothetical protein